MWFHNLQAVILAAGKATRFKTGQTKLVEKLCGQEMIAYPTKLMARMNIFTTLVVGFQQDIIRSVLNKHDLTDCTFAEQVDQKGTGHALLNSRSFWDKDHILVMNGDMPLINETIIKSLWEKHEESDAAISFVTSHNDDPSSGAYGRVVHDENGIRIVEAKHFTGNPQDHCYVNAGIYLIKRSFLEEYINSIEKNETTSEFYITDLVEIAHKQGFRVETTVASFDRVRGINTFKELWAAEQVKRSELISYWMDHGVRFSIAQNVHIDLNVTIGAGTHIGSGVQLLNGTTIGSNCIIDAFSILKHATVGDNVVVKPHCIIQDATIHNNAQIGPFAHITNKVTIGEHSHIGNFVEVNNSSVGSYTKAKHLSFIGNATIGDYCNIGAGTIFCPYNGQTKEWITIGNNVFVGSNNTLVAPLSIGNNAFTAAGSTITEDTPENAFAIARTQQTTKEEYATHLREKIKKAAALDDTSEPSFIGAIKTTSDETPSEGA